MPNNLWRFFWVLGLIILSGCYHVGGDFLLPEPSDAWSEGDDFNSIYDGDNIWISVRNDNMTINKDEFSFIIQAKSMSGVIEFSPERIIFMCGNSSYFHKMVSEVEERLGHPKFIREKKVVTFISIKKYSQEWDQCLVSFHDALPTSVVVPDLRLYRRHMSGTRFGW